jgi:hypothetical protein
MAKTYSLFNKRKNTFQPNISRQRIPFNGPISSNTLNLYYDQLMLDIARLSKNTDNIYGAISEISDLCDNGLDSATPGYYIDELLSMTIYGQKVTYDKVNEEYDVVSFNSFNNSTLQFYKNGINSSKISLLKKKLDDLEKITDLQ